MESKTNYSLVGVIVLLLAAGLLACALWLSGEFSQKSYSLYTVYLHEAASGLSEDSPVKFNGVKVGVVKAIKLNKNDPRQVEVLLAIESGTPITTSTWATLISQGITGVTYMGLSAGSSDLTPLHRLPDEPYPVIPAKPSLFNQLDAILKEVSDSVNKVSQQAQKIFNETNAKYVRNILANTSEASRDFPAITQDFKKSLVQFNAMAVSVKEAGRGVSEAMVAGKQAATKFSEQTLPPAVLLLAKLNAIAANIDKVSTSMRQNPSVIIRGSTPPKPGPGE